MDTTAVAREIQEVRRRLAEIQETRRGLDADGFAERAELKDEEHRLEARLAELSDEAADAGAGLAERGASHQSDLEHSPDLPGGPSESALI